MQSHRIEKIVNAIYILLWGSISLYVGYYHEPFADEAQAYLIARDASLSDIISTVSRTEGTPALWYIWLKFLMICGMDYSHLYLASIIPNLLAVSIFITQAPFSKSVRYLVPLTYYIFYQYNIVARNYSLLFLGAMIVSITYQNRHKYPLYFILGIIFLGSISSHGFLLALGIMGVWLLSEIHDKKSLNEYISFFKRNKIAISIYSLFCVLSVCYLYPDLTNQYIQNYATLEGYWLSNLIKLLSAGLVISSMFEPENLWYIDIGIIYFIVMNYLLNKEFGIKYWILLLPNFLFMIIVPYKPWHAGIYIMSIIFLLWQDRKEISNILRIGIGILLITELVWSSVGIVLDIKGKYATTKDIYNFLQQKQIGSSDIEQASFHCVGINPYYKSKKMSYWDWHKQSFYKRIRNEYIKNKKAIIINKEVHDTFKGRVKEIQKLGNYKIKIFESQHFFGLEDMSKDETFYVLYRN